METIETREGYIGKICSSTAEIFSKSGVRLGSNVKVVRLSPNSHKFQNTFTNNTLILGSKGLLGGGNCSSSQNEPKPKKLSSSRVEERKTKGIFISPIDLFMSKDDFIETKIKKAMIIFTEKLNTGEIVQSSIKEIDQQKITSTFNFLSIFKEILKILNLPELYHCKNCVFLRYKLSAIARKFLILYLIVKQKDLEVSDIYSMKKMIDNVKLLQSDDFFVEMGFSLNISLIGTVLDSINVPINEHLKYILQELLSNYYKESFDAEKAVEFFKTSLKVHRDTVSDLILLELLDPSQSFKLLTHMIDLSATSSWENIGLILLYFQYGAQEIRVLSEYLYFCNFEMKDVWKIRCLSLELLMQNSIFTPSSASLINTVIKDKSFQSEEPDVSKLMAAYEFYQYSVNLYLKNANEVLHLDYYHNLPKLPQSQCDISNVSLLLKSSHHKVFTIIGAPGIGKTVLALNYAYSHLSYYSLIFYIPSHSERLINKKFIEISKRLKLIIQDSLDDMINSVLRHLNKEKKPFLLIFDDAPCLESIQKYLPNAGHIIITSVNENWQLRYEIPVLEEVLSKAFLGDFYSKKLFELLECNYMATGLVVKLLKNNCVQVDTLLNLVKKDSEYSLYKIFSVFLGVINEKIPESKHFLNCLGMLENSYIPRDFSIEIIKILRVPLHYYDLILAFLNKYSLIEESKGFTILVHPSFHRFLSKNIDRPIFYVNILKQAIFSIYPKFNFLELPKKIKKISLLINKIGDFLKDDLNIDTSAVFFLKGKYELQVDFNGERAIQSFESSLQCCKNNSECMDQIRFGLACSYLKVFKASESISLFLQVIDSSMSYPEKMMANAFLVRAYDYIGNSTRIAQILIHTSNTNFQQLTLPEAVYCTIHGICRLALKYDDLQELLDPYSSFLYSRAPSISVIMTLLKLAYVFALKEKWRIVLNYVNLITPLVQMMPTPAPNTLTQTLEILENIMLELRDKFEVMVGDSHRMIAFIHWVLSKVYDAARNEEKEIQNLNIAMEIITRNYGIHHIFVAEIYYEIGIFYQKKRKNTEKALEYAELAERTVTKGGGQEFLIYSKVMDLHGMVYLRVKNFEKAKEYLQKGLELKKKVLAKSADNEEISITLGNLAALEFKVGNFESALELYHKALSPRHLTRNSLIWARKSVKICEKSSKIEEALSFQQILLIIIRNITDNKQEIYEEFNRAFNFAVLLKDYSVAIKVAEETLQIIEEINENGGNLDESKQMIKIADNYCKLGDFENAEIFMRKSFDVSLKKYGKDSTEFINAKCALGIFLKDQDRYIEALSYLNEVSEKLTGVKKGKICKEIGICYAMLQKHELAFNEFEKALTIFKENSSSLDVGKIYFLYGHYYKDDKIKAIKYLKKALKHYDKNLGKDNAETIKVMEKLEKFEKSLEEDS